MVSLSSSLKVPNGVMTFYNYREREGGKERWRIKGGRKRLTEDWGEEGISDFFH